ncbi:unnamed protein product [Mytilus coruscus]|uniref:IgGFc-binding protein N-terminal domain-containing protein n=1 Tax=Mytilus coruscus TaxID=42192 RepID=A0A6J8AQ30_MYTCO|nr:unnamed protein product [Mytilus coruscus]
MLYFLTQLQTVHPLRNLYIWIRTMETVAVICIFLFGLIDCKDFVGKHFRPVFVNITGSSDTTQSFRIINPSTTESTRYSLTIENHEKIRSISASADVFFLTETSHKYQLVDVSYFIPTEHLGTEYHVIGFCRYNSACRITIIGGHDSTSIQFALKVVPISPVYGKNGSEVVDPTFVIGVNSGDIVTYESVGDLSGTFLRGNKPFSVFHSTVVTNIHNIKSGVTRPLLPSETLGTRYFMPTTFSQHGGILKIVATKGNTRVELSSMDPIILQKPGDWVTKTITNLDKIVIDSNKSIAVATVDLEMTEDIVCPKFNSILTLSPFEQWLGSSNIVVPTLNWGNAPIYIISHDEDKYSTTIDAHSPTGTVTSITGTAHVETQITIREKRKYYLPASLIPGVKITEYKDDSFYLQNPNSSFTFFAYYGNYYRFPLNHGLNVLNEACTQSSMIPADYEDNDCDGYIDEDVCINLEDPGLDCADTDTANSGPADTAGKSFFLAFMNDNEFYQYSNVSITLTPVTSTPATIYVESSFSDWTTNFTLNHGDVKQLSARKYEVILLYDTTFHGTFGIKITSTSDILVVAQYISTESAVSSFLVYPADSIGFDYFAVTEIKGKDGKCVIVATKDNTKVRILLSLGANHTLSSSNFRIYRYGELITFKMKSRETYQFTGTDDITGSRISANKPIAVFCGGLSEDKGFVTEQMIHTQAWGKHYISPPFPDIKYVKLTIISRGNKNHVTVNSSQCGISMSLSLNYSGSYVTEIFQDLTLQQCVINILAEKEISVTVYMPLNIGVNPSNLVLPSTDQYTSNSVFVVPETPFEASTTFFVGFISSTGSFVEVTLDGTLLPQAAHHEIGIGVHSITTNKDIFVYIFAGGEKKTDGSNLPGYSYAYVASMLFQQIVQDCIPVLERIDGIDNDCDGVIDEGLCYTALNATIIYSTSAITDSSTAEQRPSTTEPRTSTAAIETMTTIVQLQETSTTETTENADVTVTNTVLKGSMETTGKTVTTETDDVDNTITPDAAESTPSMIPKGSTVTSDEATMPDTTIRPTQSNSNQETTGNTVTTEIDDMDNTNQGTDTTVGDSCYCPCSVDALNTEEKIQQRLVDLQTSLRVEKRKLSSSIRKLNSATDDRTSVRYLGISGLIILITVFLFIIMLDSINLFKAFKTRFGKYNLS